MASLLSFLSLYRKRSVKPAPVYRFSEPASSQSDPLLSSPNNQFMAFDPADPARLASVFKKHINMSYESVSPEQYFDFLKGLQESNTELTAYPAVNEMLWSLLQALIFSRDFCFTRFNSHHVIRALNIQAMHEMTRNRKIPYDHRLGIKKYLCKVPGYKDAVIFEELFSLQTDTAHRSMIRPLLKIFAILAKPDIDRIKFKIDCLNQKSKEGASPQDVHLEAMSLVYENRYDSVMDDEDLVMLLSANKLLIELPPGDSLLSGAA